MLGTILGAILGTMLGTVLGPMLGTMLGTILGAILGTMLVLCWALRSRRNKYNPMRAGRGGVAEKSTHHYNSHRHHIVITGAPTRRTGKPKEACE